MESNNPIYQWLSTVEYQGQSMLSQKLRSLRANRALAINQEQVKDTALATGIPWIRIPLEMSDDMRANGHSASRKRDSCHLNETNAPSTHETIPGSESHKRSRNCYELRPRYKTHENRYEYKGPSSAVETQSQSRKGRAKKPRGRRHTMNDDFRAINVTGNRLTLRSNTNLGIFNKGRSSSAANQHGNTPAGLAKSASVTRSQKYVAESNLAFSDMNFLSRSNLSPYPISTVRETLDGQHEREYHQQEVQFDDPAHGSKLDTSHSNKKLVDVKRKLDASVMPLLAFEEAPVSEISPVFSHSRSSSPMPHNKRRKISKQSSSIPYTWTETGVDDTEQSDALEQHLLNLLHVGVYPQALCSEITNTVLTGRYWSLAELWELLEERKASWSSEAGRQNRASPEANMGQLAAVKTSPQEVREVIALDHLDIPNAGSVQNEMSKQSADSNVACETACSVNNSPPKQPSVLHQQQDGPHEASDKPGCLSLPAARTSNSQDRFIDTLNEDQGEPFHQESAEDAVLFPASVPDVEQPHMSDIEFYELGRVDDDDVFYRTLDAAYRAIVRPEVAAEVASDLQQLLESPELNGNDLLNTPESTSIREPDILTRQAEGQEPEHLVTVSQDIVQDRYDGRPEPSWQQQLSTSHSNDPCVDQNNDLPWVATGYGQSQPRASTGIDAGQTKPPGLSGFWRQNRLY
ncbi:unnamed protein product [Penicillium nalgiovense]|uniref:Uncharacterized protein n=2 Tax=Penicillium nalgiovense TaxID=60175 RepID=A0A9W4HU49_PENNA|nr:unnamed protein product [Penicillium nalgiovense]CAG7989204.1 unnamed protein product [Penicillium nalgiovense]CAG8012842.1 unnamed protein product [Penicillium nalgiovense]CAG8036561.1 unnamed protein product [Penicillium nalgiovense]CAG8046679.1 unnamed protein product [Penicillium nalgiovense]